MLILDDTSELPPLTPQRRKAILAWYDEMMAERARKAETDSTKSVPAPTTP